MLEDGFILFVHWAVMMARDSVLIDLCSDELGRYLCKNWKECVCVCVCARARPSISVLSDV